MGRFKKGVLRGVSDVVAIKKGQNRAYFGVGMRGSGGDCEGNFDDFDKLSELKGENQGFPYRQIHTKGVEKQGTSLKIVIGNRT